jgi:hypothetical protein
MSQIERRLYTRVKCCVPITIYYNECPIAERVTVDASIGGLLIHANDLGLSLNSLVIIRLQPDICGVQKYIRIPAIVKRLTNSGIAIGFEMLEKAVEEFVSHALCEQSEMTRVLFDTDGSKLATR